MTQKKRNTTYSTNFNINKRTGEKTRRFNDRIFALNKRGEKERERERGKYGEKCVKQHNINDIMWSNITILCGLFLICSPTPPHPPINIG